MAIGPSETTWENRCRFPTQWENTRRYARPPPLKAAPFWLVGTPTALLPVMPHKPFDNAA